MLPRPPPFTPAPLPSAEHSRPRFQPRHETTVLCRPRSGRGWQASPDDFRAAVRGYDLTSSAVPDAGRTGGQTGGRAAARAPRGPGSEALCATQQGLIRPPPSLTPCGGESSARALVRS
uniref:Uncharacterized protein n=1 Tax=Panthera leo TaxID=9689 RepID=A0A8C9D2I3_PANLE